MDKVILFDLDGTLIDTNELNVCSTQYAVEKTVGIRVSYDEILPLLGEELSVLLKNFMGEDDIASGIANYREYNSNNIVSQSSMYEGVGIVLDKLKRLKLKLGIVTNRNYNSTILLLENYNIVDMFDIIVTSNCVTKPKPSPEGIILAMKELNATMDKVYFVGDSKYDILAAKNAGVKSIIIDWENNYKDHDVLDEPNFITKNMFDLLDMIIRT